MCQKISSFLINLGLFLALILPFWALPIWDIGQWHRTEGVMFGLVCAGLVCALGICLLPAAEIKALWRHPFVWGVMMMWLLPGLSGLWQPDPLRSWFGVPSYGQGGGYWLAGMMIILAARKFLWQNGVVVARKWILLILFIIALTAYLTLLPPLPDLQPYVFPDYLTFMAVSVYLCWLIWPVGHVTSHRSGFLQRGGLGRYLLLGLFITLLLVSQNKTVQLGLLIGIPVFILIWRVWRRQAWILSLCAALTLPIAVPIALYLIVGTGADLPFSHQAVTSGYWDYTLWDRGKLIDLALTAMTDNPYLHLWGQGWGQYPSYIASYLPLSGVALASSEASPNWSAASWMHFHSHSSFIEAWLAGGICLGLIAVYLPVSLVRNVREFVQQQNGQRLALWGLGVILLALTGSSWFEMPISFGISCVLFGFVTALLKKSEVQSVLSQGQALTWRAAALCLAGILCFSIFFQGNMIHKDIQIADLAVTSPPSCQLPFQDQLQGGSRSIFQTLQWQTELLDMAAEGGALSSVTRSNYYQAILSSLCAMRSTFDQSQLSPRLAVASLTLRADILLNEDLHAEFPEDQPDLKILRDHWRQDLLKTVTAFPMRGDLAIGYLTWRILARDYQAVQHYARGRLKQMPEDPVANWFLGTILLQTEADIQIGLSYLRKAYHYGIERFLTLDPEIRQMIVELS